MSSSQQKSEAAPVYAPIADVASPAWGRRSRRTVATVAAAAAFAGVAAVAVFRGRGMGGQQLRHPVQDAGLQVKEATWVQGEDFDSQAPEMDVDTEYVVDGGWGTNYDHIPTPEMCAAMCQGVDKCQAYTWVKDAGLPGCPSQCWLKDSVGVKKTAKGLVSGVPPRRKHFIAAPLGVNGPGGTLYCFALMVPGGYEQGLLKWQQENKVGIFGCDKAAVYSNKEITVAPDVKTEVVNSTLKCGYGGDSGTALNAWIFIAVWQKVIEVGDYKKMDWVVKVDPDAVFFPDRLGRLLAKHQGAGYINNCKYGMHGPIEVFSTRAIDTLAEDYKKSWDGKAPKTCVTGQHFGQWGEDMFMDQCLNKVLEVKPRPTDSKLMCEAHCDCAAWYWCNEGEDVVSYHPFKSIESYKNCLGNALGGSSS